MVAQVTGIDLTPAMLDEARRHAVQVGVSNTRWAVADSVALPAKGPALWVTYPMVTIGWLLR